MEPFSDVISFGVPLLTTVWTVLGAAAVVKVVRAAPEAIDAAPLPVSVLKPLAGADPSLRENLESFFALDHPRFEILFGVERADDPAVPIVEALLAEHPQVAARLVVGGPATGENPKVRSLRNMAAKATFDLVLVSDSNVRAPRGYLSTATRTFASDPRIGLVTNLVRGAGRRTLGAELERVQLEGFVAAGVALPNLLGDAAVVGKSMLFSRRTLESLGGLARVADVLAEDYVMGKMFQHAGLRVVVAPTVLANVFGDVGVGAFVARQLRWSMLRAKLRPGAFLLEPLTCPLAALPLAWSAIGVWSLLWLAALFAIRDGVAWVTARGAARIHRLAALSVLRDALALGIWAATPFVRHTSWRGNRFSVGAGTLLFRAPFDHEASTRGAVDPQAATR